MESQASQPLTRYQPVPDQALQIYHMIWQLESWLRTIVYVELRANYVDWESHLSGVKWPPASLKSDKQQHHMSTPHTSGISYLSFGELWRIISEERNWPLFQQYFPPKLNAFARMEEVKAIRNRIAHFRAPHPQDANRLALFLRDMESGVRRFCVRYRRALRAESDPACAELEQSWDQIGYGVELHLPNGRWLYAPEPYRDHPIIGASLSFHMRGEETGVPGALYGLKIHALRTRQVDFVRFYENTKQLHEKIVHLFLSPPDEVAVTIPVNLGTESAVEMIASFLSAGVESTRCNSYGVLESYRTEMPEYVIWPDHLLNFFDEDAKDPILVVP
jgi:hypothetical protein